MLIFLYIERKLNAGDLFGLKDLLAISKQQLSELVLDLKVPFKSQVCNLNYFSHRMSLDFISDQYLTANRRQKVGLTLKQ
jgi:hypothetical protein